MQSKTQCQPSNFFSLAGRKRKIADLKADDADDEKRRCTGRVNNDDANDVVQQDSMQQKIKRMKLSEDFRQRNDKKFEAAIGASGRERSQDSNSICQD